MARVGDDAQSGHSPPGALSGPLDSDRLDRLQNLIDVAIDGHALEDLANRPTAVEHVGRAHGGPGIAQDAELRSELLVLVRQDWEIGRALDRVLLLGVDLVDTDSYNFCIERVELAAPSAKLGCLASSARCAGARIEEHDHLVTAAIVVEIDRLAVLILCREAWERFS